MRYWIYPLTVLAAYSFVTWRGIDLLPSSQRELVPASVRNSPGGYRSFHRTTSWGFHGGK
jgi:hypothetical protein